MSGVRRTAIGVLAAVGVSLVALGSVLVVRALDRDDSPSGVVAAYFAALRSGDAERATGLGSVPSGVPSVMLTDRVVREQQRIAPMSRLVVGTARVTGAHASVPVSYTLGFTSGPVQIGQSIALSRHDGDWRLDAVAVVVQARLAEAGDYAQVLGTVPRTDTVLYFPGALPISFTNPYLQLVGPTAHVEFGGSTSVSADVEPTAAARSAATAAVTGALRTCMAAADPTCPLPDDRYVPASLKGTVDSTSYTTIIEPGSAAGVIDVTGTAAFTGSYTELDVTNRPHDKTGALTLSIHADLYPVAPLRVRWQDD